MGSFLAPFRQKRALFLGAMAAMALFPERAHSDHPVSPALETGTYNLCLNLTSTNWIKYLRGTQRNLDRFPHVFITVEEASGSPGKQVESAGFYFPAQLVHEKIESYQSENGARKECIHLDPQQANQCFQWLGRARDYFRKAATTSRDRNNPPMLRGLKGTPPLPKAMGYHLLFHNCANFAAKAWQGCSGKPLKNKS